MAESAEEPGSEEREKIHPVARRLEVEGHDDAGYDEPSSAV